MGTQSRTTEQVIADLAYGSHGVVTRRGLIAAGFTARQVGERVRRGSLIPVHGGIYRVGHAAPSLRATYLAAVLACGDGAALTGLAAAHLLGLRRGDPPVPEVLSPTERVVPGVTSHRARAAMPPLMRWHGIPTLAVADTLVSVAGSLGEGALARLCHEAGVRHRTTAGQVRAAIARRPGAAGVGRLRAVMEGDVKLVLSRLEQGFLALLRAEGLPLPETWERDRARERAAYARGDQFRRYTWGDVFEHPAPMLRELRGLLRAVRA